LYREAWGKIRGFVGEHLFASKLASGNGDVSLLVTNRHRRWPASSLHDRYSLISLLPQPSEFRDSAGSAGLAAAYSRSAGRSG